MSNLIGDEDALDGPAEQDEQDDVQQGARTRFRRKRDVTAAALIAAVAVAAGLLVWQTSDIRATTSDTYTGTATSPAPPTSFPPSLGETWRAPSPATPTPVAIGPVVITGDGGDVIGRDPVSGEERWRYHRDLPLCTLTSAWSVSVAVYERTANLLPAGDARRSGGCSEVTALDPASGQRGRPRQPDDGRTKPDLGQRNSDAELGTQLLYDGNYLTTTGRRLLTTWRSDLVQTMEYGQVPALQNPEKQPRTGCTYGSVAVDEGRVGVIERCPDDQGDRLTVYRATGNDGSDKPEVSASVALNSHGSRVIALSDECKIDAEDEHDTQQCTVVVVPRPARLLVFDEQGRQAASHSLSLAPGDLPDEDPPGHAVATNEAPGAVYWFTGSRTIALSKADLRPLWTVENALGPGTMFANRILVPVVDGIVVLNPVDGTERGRIPVDRGDYRGLVTMSSSGPMVLEQRGDVLVALR
ncbi:Rv3212 family protein [Actinophytocola sediminis]